MAGMPLGQTMTICNTYFILLLLIFYTEFIDMKHIANFETQKQIISKNEMIFLGGWEDGSNLSTRIRFLEPRGGKRDLAPTNCPVTSI